MDEQQLIDIIIQTEGWYNSKIDQLKLITDTEEPFKITFVNDDGKTCDLPDKDFKAFKVGIKIAIETLGKFPVSIKNSDDD